MPRLRDLLANGLVLRRILLAEESQAQSFARLAESVERLADRLAPRLVETSPEDLRQTSVSFTRDGEQARILDFTERMQGILGRDPSDEELLDLIQGKMELPTK